MEKMTLLEEIRKIQGLTRGELAELSGVHLKTIEALEKGTNNPDNIKLSTLLALSKALKVKAIHLLPFEIRKLIC